MLKDIKVNGQLYQINTTPIHKGFRYTFAKVSAISESPASGRLANFLRELGKEPINRTELKVTLEEKQMVVLAAGYKFSRSRAWRNLYEYYARKRK